LIALVPARRSGLRDVHEEAFGGIVELVELVREPVDGVQELPVDIELSLVPRAVAHAHRPAVPPARQVR
jgi:hypothetical protein